MNGELIPINEGNFTPRSVQENFRRLGERLGMQSLAVGPTRLAALVGGVYFEAEVSSTEDTQIRHRLQRVPSMILLSVALDSDLGNNEVRGAPNGPGGAGNTTPWTDEFIYVRAVTSTGQYGFVVV